MTVELVKSCGSSHSPDAVLDGAIDVPLGPETRYEQAESISLAERIPVTSASSLKQFRRHLPPPVRSCDDRGAMLPVLARVEAAEWGR